MLPVSVVIWMQVSQPHVEQGLDLLANMGERHIGEPLKLTNTRPDDLGARTAPFWQRSQDAKDPRSD